MSLQKIMLEIMGLSEEEYNQQQEERRKYEQSNEYKAVMTKKIEDQQKQRELEYQQKLTADYQLTNSITCNKTNVAKIIKWSSSRFNERKKHSVVLDIVVKANKAEDGVWEYNCGVYSVNSGGWGRDYRLVIYNGIAKLIEVSSDNPKIWLLKTK